MSRGSCASLTVRVPGDQDCRCHHSSCCSSRATSPFVWSSLQLAPAILRHDSHAATALLAVPVVPMRPWPAPAMTIRMADGVAVELVDGSLVLRVALRGVWRRRGRSTLSRLLLLKCCSLPWSPSRIAISTLGGGTPAGAPRYGQLAGSARPLCWPTTPLRRYAGWPRSPRRRPFSSW